MLRRGLVGDWEGYIDAVDRALDAIEVTLLLPDFKSSYVFSCSNIPPWLLTGCAAVFV